MILGKIESRFCLWLLRRHNRRVQEHLLRGDHRPNRKSFDEIMECAGATLATYERVCAESESKEWSEIDDGLKEKFSPDVWDAYMTRTLVNNLRDVIFSYQRTNNTKGTE